MSLDDRIRRQLADLAAAGLHRRAPAITDRDGIRYRVDGRPVVGLCSNDYLLFADDPRLQSGEPAIGSGAGGSRLICGDLPIHREVEQRLAELAGCEDVVLFPSGFQLNVGVLPALLADDDLAYSDALNHASLIDGLRLARTGVRILQHRAPPPSETSDGLRWWISESIFSMDGDRIDVGALARHHAHGGLSYVDEAHAFGLFAGGRGLLGASDMVPTALVGTLSKALGTAGAFLGASTSVCEWVRTRARSYVFSTGTSPALAARIARAIELVRGPVGDERRARLWDAAGHLAHRLGVLDDPAPILPVLVGANEHALAISNALLERGWHVQPIRPPTVPTGTSRLRITVSAGHDRSTIDAFVDDLLALLDRHRIEPRFVRGCTTGAEP